MWFRKILPAGAVAALLLLGSNVASATPVDVSGTDGLQSGGETNSDVPPTELVPGPQESVLPLTVGDTDLGAGSPEADTEVSDGNQPAPIAADDWDGFWELTGDVLTIHDGVLPSTSCAEGGGPWAKIPDATIKEVVFTDAANTWFGESTACMFSYMTLVTSIPDIGSVNTEQVIDMGGMFTGASSLEELDVSRWVTSQVTNMGAMFDGASSLETLAVSDWDTSKVKSMYYMFGDASSLKELDVSDWDTGQVVDMGNMFDGASSLEALDVSDWDTVNVRNMKDMFRDTDALRELTLGANSKFF